jgi:hypothetical protein
MDVVLDLVMDLVLDLDATVYCDCFEKGRVRPGRKTDLMLIPQICHIRRRFASAEESLRYRFTQPIATCRREMAAIG